MTDGFKRRKQSRWGEGAALRDEILDAAARLLAQSGREGDLSLRAVAREVGISAPSIYLHFKDRRDLVEAVTQQAYDRLVAELDRARKLGDADGPHEALRAMVRCYCRFALDNPRQYRLMFGIERVEVDREDARTHPLHAVMAAWTEAVAACRDGGSAGAGADRVARLLWSSVHGMVAMSMTVPFAVDPQRMEEMAQDLLGLALAR
ncbi:TetR/AcrR family transcriptional regulator [Streptomyces thermodiastaticus]|jgi:AcrR family transcriptional regulator|uniref:TetR/AcrR family transcriptional regulator n=1 Tax=Streptomyces thermodiastaticus TaxID=44061 RepID=UPI001677CF0C|nr:TetR/AcrR family transcriptional regulator [Streptomyces thermodiastaticus]GHF75577.1 hypothetical protein GCM10018787_25390 [Streptomyces thermodiastaticus]